MEAIYLHLNNQNYLDSFSSLPEDKKNQIDNYTPLNKPMQLMINSCIEGRLLSFNSQEAVNKCYLLYHIEQSDIQINAIGISNPKKVQGYMHLYVPLIAASISRIIKLNANSSNWNIFLFTDSKTEAIINEFVNERFSYAKENITLISIQDENAQYPMWFRFHIFRYALKKMSEVDLTQTEIYCIDSDYIPSQRLNSLSPFLNQSDIVFTTNKDSYPLWQINEGVYAVKANNSAVTFFNYCSYIYESLIIDQVVRDSWKNPKIWRGAQAALMLSTFNFQDTHKSQQNCTINLNIKENLVTIRRFSGEYLNNPPCSLFNIGNWGIDKSRGYHFTGNHKYNPKLKEFIQYCTSSD